MFNRVLNAPLWVFELQGVSWFKFTRWLLIYARFTQNELIYWLFQRFVKIRNKLFNDFPEYLPMAASVDKLRINDKSTKQVKNIPAQSQQ